MSNTQDYQNIIDSNRVQAPARRRAGGMALGKRIRDLRKNKSWTLDEARATYRAGRINAVQDRK